jgi:hypothetical protein
VPVAWHVLLHAAAMAAMAASIAPWSPRPSGSTPCRA